MTNEERVMEANKILLEGLRMFIMAEKQFHAPTSMHKKYAKGMKAALSVIAKQSKELINKSQQAEGLINE